MFTRRCTRLGGSVSLALWQWKGPLPCHYQTLDRWHDARHSTQLAHSMEMWREDARATWLPPTSKPYNLLSCYLCGKMYHCILGMVRNRVWNYEIASQNFLFYETFHERNCSGFLGDIVDLALTLVSAVQPVFLKMLFWLQNTKSIKNYINGHIVNFGYVVHVLYDNIFHETHKTFFVFHEMNCFVKFLKCFLFCPTPTAFPSIRSNESDYSSLCAHSRICALQRNLWELAVWTNFEIITSDGRRCKLYLGRTCSKNHYILNK